MKHSFAMVFPGQGSQSVGMLADIATQYQEVAETFTEASDVLGYDLWKLTSEGPAEVLDQTIHTQPALLAASYAVWRIIESRIHHKPLMLAGHSLGEYTALVCAEALSFSDAVKLVSARGHYMQEAVAQGDGAMAAIVGLENEKVAALCKQAIQSVHEVLSPANYNSVGQVVIAGHKAPVERAVQLAKEQGAKLAMLIPVSVPSHCELMKPAANRLQSLLDSISIQNPKLPVINNVDVVVYETADQIRQGLVAQLYMPVRWVETIQTFMKAGITHVVECGPGKVLSGLNKRIDKSLTLMTTGDVANLEAFLKTE